jgi:general secretion pathway protein J
VLVALAVMAVLASMAWRGIDAMAGSRTTVKEAVDRTLRLQTALAQWEQDLQAVRLSGAVPALRFDGARLRLTREASAGLQVVVWSLRDGAWWRWAGSAVTSAADLREQWSSAQQLTGKEPGTLSLVEGVEAWQVYFFRTDAWTNAQSAGDPATGRAGARPGPAGAAEERLPEGVRTVLTVRGAPLTRDLVVPSQMP